MRDRRKSEKKGSSRSTEKRSTSKKHQLNLLLHRELNQTQKNRAIFDRNVDSERRQARSQQSSRKSQK